MKSFGVALHAFVVFIVIAVFDVVDLLLFVVICCQSIGDLLGITDHPFFRQSTAIAARFLTGRGRGGGIEK